MIDLMSPQRCRSQRRLGRSITVCLMLVAAVGCSAGESNRRISENNLAQIGIALHNYDQAFGHLPPAAICDREGKPLLSWRVAILPFIEQNALYKQFRLDEPWDSPHNLPASQVIVPTYQSPGVATSKPHLTYYKVFVSKAGTKPASMFIENEKIKLGQVTAADGMSNTLMVVESSGPAEWAKPDDIPFDPTQPISLTGPRQDGLILVLMGDGHTHRLKEGIPPNLLKALITYNGAEAIDTAAAFAR